MARPIARRALSRRTLLRGAGAAIALPWLDAMHPAVSRTPRPSLRTVFCFVPNGVDMRRWTPAATGPRAELSETLAPLTPVREHVTVLSGLALDAGRAHGDGPGDHARAAASYLTATHPNKKGPLRCGVSIDQVIARAIGRETKLASLEIGMEAGRSAGACDSGYSCAYSSAISWRTPTTPLAKLVRPAAVFARLFGDPHELLAEGGEMRHRKRLRSVLDAALEDARDLRRRLGPTDRSRLEQYLEAVRTLEQRIEQAERQEERGQPRIPHGLAERVAGHARDPERLDLLYDLLELALVSNTTRVATFMLGNAGSNRTYRFLGIPQGHHYLSHHRGDARKIDKIAAIDRFHVQRFARFLANLAAREEADSTLLDLCAIVYGSGLGDGNRHDHMNLPVLLAGRAGGAFQAGGHRRFSRHTPMANLYVTLLQALGLPDRAFADSTGTLAL